MKEPAGRHAGPRVGRMKKTMRATPPPDETHRADFEALTPWAEKQGVHAASNEELVADPRVRDLIGQEATAVNADTESPV